MALLSIPLKWLLTGAGATTIGALGVGAYLLKEDSAEKVLENTGEHAPVSQRQETVTEFRETSTDPSISSQGLYESTRGMTEGIGDMTQKMRTELGEGIENARQKVKEDQQLGVAI